MSPPDSMQTSSDDDEKRSRRKSRGPPRTNLAGLQEAIRTLERQRADLADAHYAEAFRNAEGLESQPSSPSPQPQQQQQQQPNEATSWPHGFLSAAPPLSRSARKVSHSRSSTDGAIRFDQGATTSPHDSDETETMSPRPSMVRKKSGELVKPALRVPSRRRPLSMPGTPTYSKAVHFDSQLEHVRHFLKVDRPLAVSARSSPVDGLETDSEYPFSSSGDESFPSPRSSPSAFEWDIVVANFPPADGAERRALPIRVERIFLSKDRDSLIGAVAVANLAFHKTVVARFTLDDWKTTSEVVAEYDPNVRGRVDDGCDRFHFSIRLADQAKLDSKTLLFCVRYNVAGMELWDNNGHANFRVSFARKPCSSPLAAAAVRRNNGNFAQPLSGLGARPLSAIQRNRSGAARPLSMPQAASGDLGRFEGRYNFADLNLRSSSPLTREALEQLDSDADDSSGESDRSIRARRNSYGGQMFGHRYDFGASLSAAIKSASSTTISDNNDNGGKGGNWYSPGSPPATFVPTTIITSPPEPGLTLSPVVKDARGSPPVPATSTTTTTTPATTTASVYVRPDTYISQRPAPHSKAYLELIDKFCYMRTGTPPIAGTS